MKAFKLVMGDDVKWWGIPTKPDLRINYLERVFDVEKV